MSGSNILIGEYSAVCLPLFFLCMIFSAFRYWGGGDRVKMITGAAVRQYTHRHSESYNGCKGQAGQLIPVVPRAIQKNGK